MKKISILLLSSAFVLCSLGASAQYGYSGFNSNNSAMAAYLNWLMYQKTKEEGGNLKKWWKGEESIATTFSGPLNYVMRYTLGDGSFGGGYHDTLIKGTGTIQPGLSINSNGNHLLVRIGQSSMVSLSVGTQVDWYRWKIKGFNEETGAPQDKKLWLFQAGIPVTVDFKSGCDVDWDPGQRTCWAVGAGVYPSFALSLYDGVGSDGFARIAPYAYASFGFYAGGCFKVRASVVPYNFRINGGGSSSINGIDRTAFNATGNGMFTIGIGYMIYSNDWTSGRAWRVRAFSNEGGGGGRTGHRLNGRMF